jgi:hypothetical protein
MKQSSKILLASATIWPFVYMLLFVGMIFFSFLSGEGGSNVLWGLIIPLHVLTMLLIFALMTFYIVNVFRNDRVNKDMKLLWVVVLFMGGLIAMPIYWYLYIWPTDPASSEHLQLGPRASSFDRDTKDREAAYVPPPQPPDWR